MKFAQPDRPSGPAHAHELVRDRPVIRREHRAERRRDDVELAVAERQRLGVGLDPLELDAARCAPRARPASKFSGVRSEATTVRAGLGRADGDVAGARRDVEHALPGADAARLPRARARPPRRARSRSGGSRRDAQARAGGSPSPRRAAASSCRVLLRSIAASAANSLSAPPGHAATVRGRAGARLRRDRPSPRSGRVARSGYVEQPGPHGVARPRRCARAGRACGGCCVTCRWTVCSLTTSRSAICRFVSPSARRRSTSRSRASAPGAGSPARRGAAAPAQRPSPRRAPASVSAAVVASRPRLARDPARRGSSPARSAPGPPRTARRLARTGRPRPRAASRARSCSPRAAASMPSARSATARSGSVPTSRATSRSAASADRRLVELAARDPGVDEQLERREAVERPCGGELAQQPLGELRGPLCVARRRAPGGRGRAARRRRPRPGRAARAPRSAVPAGASARPARRAGRRPTAGATRRSPRATPPASAPPRSSGRARGRTAPYSARQNASM